MIIQNRPPRIEVMRLYLNFHTYNDKSEMDYLIYEEIPASSKSRQISPVDLIYRPKFNYRSRIVLRLEKGRFLTDGSLA